MRGFASLTASLAAVAFLLTCFSGMHSVNGDKTATADDLPDNGVRLLSLQEARSEELNGREMSPRAVSLSHKYVGLGRRSSNDNNGDGQQRTAASGLSDENDDKPETAGRDPAIVPEADDFIDGKRAMPSSLRFTGLGKRRQGVSAAMRYAGLGKRFPESADAPETENDDVGSDAVKSGDSRQTSMSETDSSARVHQLLHRRKRFAVDLLDDISADEYDDEQEDDEEEEGPIIYSVKRQPATETTIVKPRIGVGMRYVGVGKRKLNVRSRVDAGMRYMGIGKRSRY